MGHKTQTFSSFEYATHLNVLRTGKEGKGGCSATLPKLSSDPAAVIFDCRSSTDSKFPRKLHTYTYPQYYAVPIPLQHCLLYRHTRNI